MASGPGGDDSVPQVRSYYEEHTHVIFGSHIVDLIATVTLAPFQGGVAGR